jgi:hypothetical protein
MLTLLVLPLAKGFTVTWPHKDREVWFSLIENHEKVLALRSTPTVKPPLASGPAAVDYQRVAGNE